MADYDTIVKTMMAKFTELSGIAPDGASDIGIRMKVLAAQIYSLTTELDGIKRQLFPTTAQAKSLDMHAQMRGLCRKTAVNSSGVLRFLRQTPATYDITIAAGTICQTESGGVRFETTDDCVLPKGALYAEAPAKSVQSGEKANVAAQRVCVFVTAPQGVYGVTNPAPFTGGTDAESDTALRERLLSSYQTISNGTNAAFYYNEAMGYDFVYSASVLARARGIGTVDVAVAGRGVLLTSQDLALISADFARKKEICVDVLVKPPVLRPVTIAIGITPCDEYGFDGVKAALETHITEFMSGRRIGFPLLLAELSNCVYGFDGVYNHRVTAPLADTDAAPDELITLGTLTVTRLE